MSVSQDGAQDLAFDRDNSKPSRFRVLALYIGAALVLVQCTGLFVAIIDIMNEPRAALLGAEADVNVTRLHAPILASVTVTGSISPTSCSPDAISAMEKPALADLSGSEMLMSGLALPPKQAAAHVICLAARPAEALCGGQSTAFATALVDYLEARQNALAEIDRTLVVIRTDALSGADGDVTHTFEGAAGTTLTELSATDRSVRSAVKSLARDGYLSSTDFASSPEVAQLVPPGLTASACR